MRSTETSHVSITTQQSRSVSLRTKPSPSGAVPWLVRSRRVSPAERDLQKTLTIDTAQISDHEALHRLLENSRPLISAETLRQIDKFLPHFIVVRSTVVGSDKERLVGLVASVPIAESLCEVRSLAVDRGHRSLKLGRWLLNAVVQAADQHGETLVCVTCAAQFFEKFGFEPCVPHWRGPVDIALGASES
jgi:N-acetylglutamate synthase-like GNAT family acetyltransferase